MCVIHPALTVLHVPYTRPGLSYACHTSGRGCLIRAMPEQLASAPHMLRIVPHTVPCLGRSCEHFPDGFEFHLLNVLYMPYSTGPADDARSAGRDHVRHCHQRRPPRKLVGPMLGCRVKGEGCLGVGYQKTPRCLLIPHEADQSIFSSVRPENSPVRSSSPDPLAPLCSLVTMI
jgi:hypothetical protein